MWTHGYLIYTLRYNTVLLYIVCCSDGSSFGHWELFHLATVSFSFFLIEVLLLFLKTIYLFIYYLFIYFGCASSFFKKLIN